MCNFIPVLLSSCFYNSISLSLSVDAIKKSHKCIEVVLDVVTSKVVIHYPALGSRPYTFGARPTGCLMFVINWSSERRRLMREKKWKTECCKKCHWWRGIGWKGIFQGDFHCNEMSKCTADSIDEPTPTLCRGREREREKNSLCCYDPVH